MSKTNAPNYWSLLLAQLRKDKNWSQADLANHLGVSRETVSRWESESTYPSIKQQKKIGLLAEESNIASVYGIAKVVNHSPYPMILTDINDYVLAASASSGFDVGNTVVEQTAEGERANYLLFSKQVADTGFWEKEDNILEYEFIDGEEKRRAVVQSVGSRGHIFALVQRL